jgi:hypothetical protein
LAYTRCDVRHVRMAIERELSQCVLWQITVIRSNRPK